MDLWFTIGNTPDYMCLLPGLASDLLNPDNQSGYQMQQVSIMLPEASGGLLCDTGSWKPAGFFLCY